MQVEIIVDSLGDFIDTRDITADGRISGVITDLEAYIKALLGSKESIEIKFSNRKDL